MRKIAVLLAVLAVPALAQIPLPTAPTKFVTDAAGVIPDDREYVLNERLAYFEHTTTHQVIVYVDRKIPEGTTLEEMSAEAIRMWAVGQEEFDNGVILFLFLDSRDSRIEVGYGLEGTLTDARSKRILVGMRPMLRSGDYAGAVEEGATAILDVISAAERPAPPPQPQPVAKITHDLGPVPDARPSSLDEALGCFIPAGFLLVVVFLVVALVRKGSRNSWMTTPSDRPDDQWPPVHNPPSTWSPPSSDSSPSFSDFGSSSGSGSSSSGSGFSGGGGSGGGGGASDKW